MRHKGPFFPDLTFLILPWFPTLTLAYPSQTLCLYLVAAVSQSSLSYVSELWNGAITAQGYGLR